MAARYGKNKVQTYIIKARGKSTGKRLPLKRMAGRYPCLVTGWSDERAVGGLASLGAADRRKSKVMTKADRSKSEFRSPTL